MTTTWITMVAAALVLAGCGPLASTPPQEGSALPSKPDGVEVLGAGARGQTATEMDTVLHADGLDGHAAGNALDRALQDRNQADGVDLATANRLWVQQGLELTEEYIATIAGNYGAGLAATDFTADPQAARTAVNQWVADMTRDKVTELFPAGTIDATTRLVLANAVHLDAAWKFPFDPARTDEQAFTLADGTRVDVPTMHYDEHLPTAMGPDWAAVELPYDGEQLSMTIIVPQDLAAFEQRLDAELLTDILGQITDGGSTCPCLGSRHARIWDSTTRWPAWACPRRSVPGPTSRA